MRLNTQDFDSKLNGITKKINNINNSLNKNRGMSKFNNSIDYANRALDRTYYRLRSIVRTYLGLMGTRAILDTSDTITSAQNKLNYVTANQMGSTGYNSDGSYSNAVFKSTELAMDKMYASAQKVRMGYADMMSNVSKSMALAGASFDNNTDKAIRFQEIMAEAYAIGGASAAEMSSSMYQMIQALGAGTLAGDELRSVREGAPLAYKAIEEFAQGVYNTEESLKDLASQGKITSDMVVEAIMNSGKKMDEAFAQTKQTFAQTWTQIKNAAVQAFRPISEQLQNILTSVLNNGFINKLEAVFINVSKAVYITIELIKRAVVWIADNWDWLYKLIILGISYYIAYMITMTSIAIVNAAIRFALWLTEYWYIALIIAAIATLIYIFYMWKTAAIDTIEAIILALLTLGMVAFVVGSIMTMGWLMVVGAILVVLGIALYYFEYISAGVMWLGAIFYNFCAWVGNLGNALGGALTAVFDNICIWWHNICASMGEAFWNFVADTLSNFKGLGDAINAVYKLMGGVGTISINSIITGSRQIASNYANSKQDYKSIGDAWNSGWNTFDYKNLGDAYNKGLDWGLGVKDSINEWGSQYQNGFSLDNLANKLGIDLSSIPDKFPSYKDPAYNVADGITPTKAEDLLKDVSGINDNTGSMAEAMELTNEDLSYLRKLAEAEWKKEYTTAQIVVEMNNTNTVNGETDLDGIVTKLSEKLYEEMSVLANGVYA